jgi:chaperonin cofactor prefoldin
VDYTRFSSHPDRQVQEQQKQIENLTAQLKEQAAQIQKVSARIEVTKPASQVVDNNR